MFCRFCGQSVPDDSLFCPYCGRNFSVQTKTESTPLTEEPTSAVQAEPAVPVQAEIPATAEVQPQRPVYSPLPASDPVPTPHSQRNRWIAMGSALPLLLTVFAILLLTKALCFHKWQPATCTAPITCVRCERTKGEALGHTPREATCMFPGACTTCGYIFEEALGHVSLKYPCAENQHCYRCQAFISKTEDHILTEETFTEPPICKKCGAVRPMTQPASGTVYQDSKYHGSNLTVHGSGYYNIFMKLKDKDGNEVFSFYIKAGEKTTVRVPSGNYYLYYAYGRDWYGPERAFGDTTRYARTEEILDFYNYTWTYQFGVEGEGNSTSVTISEDEF